MFITVAVVLAVIAGLVAFIISDQKLNPGRDWHAEDES